MELLTLDETTAKVKDFVCQERGFCSEIGFRMYWYYLPAEQKVELFNRVLGPL